jgi:hypothetical protein
MKTFAFGRYSLIAVLSIGLGACGGGAHMVKSDKQPVIKQDEAMMVFMRSASFGGSAIAALVLDVSGPEAKFIGMVNKGTKVAYPVKPGEYTFMVVSEAADFMQATVVPGKTCYAMVTPRLGLWKARFSFTPVRKDDAEFAGWDSETHFVEHGPRTLEWAQRNSTDINSKRFRYWPDWTSKPAPERAAQTLNAEDCR